MGRAAAKVLGSLLVVPTALALYLGVGGVSACGRATRHGARDPSPPEGPRRRITVLLGEGADFAFAFSPLHPEAERARRDSESLARRFALPEAGLARLLLLRFGSAPAPFDPRAVVARAVGEGGEEVTLRPLAAHRPPASPRDALLFRSLAGPSEPALLPGGSSLSLALVVPGARDPEGFRRIEVAGAVLSPVDLDVEEWKGFLAAAKRDLFRRVAATAAAPAATAPSSR